MSPAPAYDNLQPRPPGGLLPGAGLSLLVHADLGLASWDVLHQAVAKVTGL